MQFSSSRLYYLFEVEGWPKEGDMTDSTITPLLQWRILTRLFFFSNSSSLIRKTRSKTWFNLEGKKDRKFEEAASSQNHKFSCSELRFDNDDSSNLITYCIRLLILTIREAFTQCHMEHLGDREDKKSVHLFTILFQKIWRIIKVTTRLQAGLWPIETGQPWLTRRRTAPVLSPWFDSLV